MAGHPQGPSLRAGPRAGRRRVATDPCRSASGLGIEDFLAARLRAAFLAAVLRVAVLRAVVLAAFLAAVLRTAVLRAVVFAAFFAAVLRTAFLRAVVFLAAVFFAARLAAPSSLRGASCGRVLAVFGRRLAGVFLAVRLRRRPLGGGLLRGRFFAAVFLAVTSSAAFFAVRAVVVFFGSPLRREVTFAVVSSSVAGTSASWRSYVVPMVDVFTRKDRTTTHSLPAFRCMIFARRSRDSMRLGNDWRCPRCRSGDSENPCGYKGNRRVVVTRCMRQRWCRTTDAIEETCKSVAHSDACRAFTGCNAHQMLHRVQVDIRRQRCAVTSLTAACRHNEPLVRKGAELVVAIVDGQDRRAEAS